MMQKELLLLWNHASVKVMDVRHQIVQPGETQRFDPLPSSVFLYFIRGRAEVLLGELAYSVRRFHVIHGGKGLTLEITACENDSEYYILFYKAVISLPCRQEIMQLLERRNWFLAPYAFVPQQSVALFDQVEKLHAVWQVNDANPVRQLRARGLFQLFVSELLRQMDEEARGYGKADLVSQAKQLIHTHYSEPLTLEAIAQKLNYSIPYLSRQFKQQTGHSPIDYLIRVRLDRAKALLVQTDASLQEVAEGVGYSDLSYFIRAFKKHTGVTPGQCKEQAAGIRAGSEYPVKRLRSSLVGITPYNYNLFNNENHYQKSEGENVQRFRKGTKGKMHKLMLGLALLLSACSGPGNGGAVNSNPPQSTQQATEASATANAQQTKQQWPRTYVDATGKEVVIAKQPQRVAVTHFGMMEYFFALETPPIASTLAERMLGSFETLKPYAKTATVKDIGEVTTPNLELMTELEPDLIVAFSGTHNDVYEDLRHISTVAMINNTEERTWAETLREYAKLVGKEQLAEDYITKLEALMAEARGKLAAKKDKTVTFLRASGDGSTFYVLDDNDVSYAFDEKSGLGLKPPGPYKLEGDVVSLEGVTVLDPDYIFLVDYLDNMDTTLAELNKSKVWQSLKAVKANQVYPLDVSISTKGPLAVEHTTRELLRVLAE
ncbi:AraC family transcriptional regulator [Brevibacillus sp. SAFN-007a]|uniref:AraC family transcriptional regulator n=1 Tax=Brevibacillus sp. SAFN-007a TaxID=3436862 RepID=UPI003F7E9C5F